MKTFIFSRHFLKIPFIIGRSGSFHATTAVIIFFDIKNSRKVWLFFQITILNF